MTLPASFPISASQINVELGRAPGAPFSMSGAEERALAEVPSGAISMSDFLGKSSAVVEQTDSRTFLGGSGTRTFTNVDYGSETGRTGVVVLVWHGDTGNNPGLNPGCTISGVSAARYQPHSTGTGVVHATGTAIFIGNPSGNSGDVGVFWQSVGAPPLGIVVLRLVGISLTPSFTWGGSPGIDDGSQALTLVNKDTIIAIAGRGQSATDIVWSNLTERGDELNQGAGADNRRSWAFDFGVAAGSRTVSFTPWGFTDGDNTWSGIVLPSL